VLHEKEEIKSIKNILLTLLTGHHNKDLSIVSFALSRADFMAQLVKEIHTM